jgi:uncharacterized membrane protein
VNGWTLAGTSFLASAVEAVEALTIVLAVGVTRSWPVALRGTAFALLVLALIIALFGPLLHLIPIDQLKLVVGIVLTLFGLAWLRKAILRFAGRKALRDEDAAYDREVSALRAAEEAQADQIGLVTAFKAVLIEGLEVAIIVVTFGIAWWGADLSLLLLAAFYLAVSAALVAAARVRTEVTA